MKLVFANEKEKSLGSKNEKVVMLCGPTPRSPWVKSWRPEAIKLFQQLSPVNGGPDVLLIPEHSSWTPQCDDYYYQIDWEHRALVRADVIMFWIPRDLCSMPGLTTNVEFGSWMNSGKVILGFPPEAAKMSYMAWHARQLEIPMASTLVETVQKTIAFLDSIDPLEKL